MKAFDGIIRIQHPVSNNFNVTQFFDKYFIFKVISLIIESNAFHSF